MREAGRDVLDGAGTPRCPCRSTGFDAGGAASISPRCLRGLGLLLSATPFAGPARTRAQAGLQAGERHLNGSGAFTLAWRFRWPRLRRLANCAPERLDGLVVVLVDDVSTTGATRDACARVLLDAGTREVRVLTVARVAARPR
jgi:hypothetical protein